PAAAPHPNHPIRDPGADRSGSGATACHRGPHGPGSPAPSPPSRRGSCGYSAPFGEQVKAWSRPGPARRPRRDTALAASCRPTKGVAATPLRSFFRIITSLFKLEVMVYLILVGP